MLVPHLTAPVDDIVDHRHQPTLCGVTREALLSNECMVPLRAYLRLRSTNLARMVFCSACMSKFSAVHELFAVEL